MNQTVRSAILVIGFFLPASVGIGSHLAAATGCTPQAKAVEQEALSLADIACLLAPAVDPELPDAAMAACQIEQRLKPLVMPLLQQKKAAKRAATCAPDAGK